MTAVVSPISEKSASFQNCRDTLKAFHGIEAEFAAWQEWNRQASDPQHNRFRVMHLGTVAEHLTLWAVKIGGVEKTDTDDRFIPMVRNRRNGAFVAALPLDSIQPHQAEELAFLSNAGQQAFQKAKAEIIAIHGLNYLTLEEWMNLCRQARDAKASAPLNAAGRELRRVELRRGKGLSTEIFPSPILASFNPKTGFVDGAVESADVIAFPGRPAA